MFNTAYSTLFLAVSVPAFGGGPYDLALEFFAIYAPVVLILSGYSIVTVLYLKTVQYILRFF